MYVQFRKGQLFYTFTSIQQMRKLFILLILILPFCVTSQQIEPKHTFNIELGLPNGFANKPFKDIMQGLVAVAPYYQYTFKSSLAVAAGLRYSYFGVNQFRVPEKTLGGMHSPGAFIKVSREKFHTDRFSTDMGVKFGYTQNYFSTIQPLDSNVRLLKQVNAVLIEPTIRLALVADDQVSYSFIIGYAFQGFKFKNDMIGFESLMGYSESDYRRTTSFLTIGFGFTYYFKERN
jgi:hypothetical protein